MKIVFEGTLTQVLQQIREYVSATGLAVAGVQTAKPAAAKPAAADTSAPQTQSEDTSEAGLETVDYDTALAALKAYMKKHGKDKAVAVLTKYNVDRLSELKEFADIYKDLTNG